MARVTDDRRGATGGPLGDLLLVAAIAVVVRALYLLEYRNSPFFDFLHLDPRYYHDWALAIASGDWLGKEVFEQSPLYSYLLAVYFIVFGQKLFLLRVLQFGVGAVTAVLISLLGRRLFGRAAGLAAGIGAALYGPFIFYEGQVMKEFLTPFFSALMLLLIYRGLDDARRGWRSFAAAGFVIGVGGLVRDNFLLLLPIFVSYLLLKVATRLWDPPERGGTRVPRNNSNRQERVPDPPSGSRSIPTISWPLCMVGGALVALLPVLWRNHHVSGEWVLTTSGGGEVFYIGNGPYANGAYVPPPWVRSNPRYEHEDFRRRAREITGRPLTRGESSRFWYGEGLRAIADRPGHWCWLMIRKAFLFLDDHELPDNYSFYSFRRFSTTLSVLPTFAWVAALAAPGLFLTFHLWRRLLPLYLAGAGYMGSVLIFFNFARFRLPFVPVLLVVAGAGAAALAGAVADVRAKGAPARGAARRMAMMAVIGAAVFALTHVDLSSSSEEPFQDRLHLAAAYRQSGKDAEAESLLRETIRDAEAILAKHGWRPGMGAVPGGVTFATALRSAHRDLAGILLAGHRDDAAIAELLAAIPLDPNDADMYQALGQAYRSKGDGAAAERAYEAALGLRPDSFTIRYDLATALYESGDAAGALRELIDARKRNPGLADLDLADWNYGMGFALAALQGREAESVPHLAEGLRLNPDAPGAPDARKLLAGTPR
ncbi:MAG: glycosyltransferase family 39 protein [Acidobacteria bacterium]|nr:glycosyltransferase family 39 protein [Acidobacteriota bacterium]